MRRQAIREYFMSKCKPRESAKDFWNAICPCISKMNKTQRNLILKEGDSFTTKTSELCEILEIFSVL